MLLCICMAGQSLADPISPEGLDGDVTADRLPKPAEEHLILGMTVWQANCQGCHGLGIAGSPKITNRTAWAPRIAKGLEVLFSHAKNGHFGPMGTEMPPRGGNPNLTDKEVEAAVTYMVANSGGVPAQ